jgi:hypothetical protein
VRSLVGAKVWEKAQPLNPDEREPVDIMSQPGAPLMQIQMPDEIG